MDISCRRRWPGSPELHLADLHARAAELGVPRFRLLRRSELVSEIEARRAAASMGSGGGRDRHPREPEPEPRRRRSGDEAEGDERSANGSGSTRRHRGGDRSCWRSPRSATGSCGSKGSRREARRRIRLGCPRCGDASCAPVTRSRGRRARRSRGERHRALVHVDRVNGGEPLANPSAPSSTT